MRPVCSGAPVATVNLTSCPSFTNVTCSDDTVAAISNTLVWAIFKICPPAFTNSPALTSLSYTTPLMGARTLASAWFLFSLDNSACCALWLPKATLYSFCACSKANLDTKPLPNNTCCCLSLVAAKSKLAWLFCTCACWPCRLSRTAWLSITAITCPACTALPSSTSNFATVPPDSALTVASFIGLSEPVNATTWAKSCACMVSTSAADNCLAAGVCGDFAALSPLPHAANPNNTAHIKMSILLCITSIVLGL